jgi:hypothetical protein
LLLCLCLLVAKPLTAAVAPLTRLLNVALHMLHDRLWLNGGPGCSSFDGWVYEQGPFKLSLSRERNEVTLSDNPYAWNKVANMIFLDSPSRELAAETRG